MWYEQRRSLIPESPVTLWQPFHAAFIGFAYDSLKRARPRGAHVDLVRLDRATVDVVLYANAALEASVESTMLFASTGQLSRTLSEWGRSNYSQRKWTKFSLAEQITFVSQALVDGPFWTNPNQQQLYCDLRRLRNELTHPRPIGMELKRSRILPAAYGVRLLEPGRQIEPGKSITSFGATPDRLGKEDAEQVFEILLRHLIRLEEISGPGTSFGIFDEDSNELLSPSDMLSRLYCRFEGAWTGGQTPVT